MKAARRRARRPAPPQCTTRSGAPASACLSCERTSHLACAAEPALSSCSASSSSSWSPADGGARPGVPAGAASGCGGDADSSSASSLASKSCRRASGLAAAWTDGALQASLGRRAHGLGARPPSWPAIGASRASDLHGPQALHGCVADPELCRLVICRSTCARPARAGSAPRPCPASA